MIFLCDDRKQGGTTATHPVIAFPAVLIMLAEAAVPFLATWAATAIFNIEFGIAYQIMTFGQCLIANDSEKD